MYCTEEDIRQILKTDLLAQLVSGEAVASPEEAQQLLSTIIEQAIADAGAEIDGYLAARYPVPLSKPPTIISKYAKDLAVYNLVSRIGVGGGDDRENNYLKRYQYAIKFLEMVAKGTVELGIASPSRQAATGFQMTGPPRIFSRDSLKGM